jgi:hypothetical protein
MKCTGIEANPGSIFNLSRNEMIQGIEKLKDIYTLLFGDTFPGEAPPSFHGMALELRPWQRGGRRWRAWTWEAKNLTYSY